MARMIDLVRQSAVPANVMRSASKGALNLPPAEMIEILVYLTGNAIFGQDAKMTLARWDEASSVAAASNPATPWEVLTYMIAPANLRPVLVPALLENPSVREATLMELAQTGSPELLGAMLESRRVKTSEHLLQALLTNPALTAAQTAQVKQLLKDSGAETGKIEAYSEADSAEKTQYEVDHAAEIAAEEAAGKAFELYGQDADLEDIENLEAVLPAEETPVNGGGETVAAASAEAAPAPAAAEVALPAEASAGAPAPESLDERTQKIREAEAKSKERLSALQKIARLSVGQRIQLAMKGSKEERFILVRDGSKLVSQAVLQSPKVSDQEVEGFAAMKNVQEGVLRDIARNHKFMKNYSVVRTLTNNPRCPLDLSLTLMGHLLVNDLKALSTNKNVPDTLKKLAFKRFKEKTEKKKG